MKFLTAAKYFCLLICSILLGTFIFNTQNLNSSKICFSSDTIEQNVYDKIDTYLNKTTTLANFPAMSITIVDKSQTLLSQTYGECENTETPFLLGSVSKSFTALCIMQLVEQGKIDLNANLSSYLPNATDGNKITILNLLNHTSGLGEHQNLTNYKIINKTGEHVYANVNYSLLGKVVEAVSNLSYEDYIQQNIFTPLKMNKSAATIEQAKSNGLIDSYENWFGFNIKTEPKYPKDDSSWITTPAGYLSSSTTDLGKYLQMYLNGGQNIVSSESINKMFYSNVDVEASIPYKYGMGWTLINEPLSQPVLRHSGLVETGMSVICLIPESEIGFAIAINTNDYFVGKDMMDRIDWGVVLMLLGEEPNQIGENEYIVKHFLYDSIYFIVIIFSILPLVLISIYKKRLLKGKLWIKIALLILLHLFIPIFLLLLPRLFFATPLWVVKAFVPGLYISIILVSCLFFIGGIVKSIILILNKNKY